MEQPTQLSEKELLNMHGPTGGLVIRLQRYALLGWLLAGVLLFVLVAYVFLDKVFGTPVLAVNEEGQVLGHFEYLSGSSRTDDEIMAGGQRFLRDYLSANSSFIMEDYTRALNMMAVELREQKLAEVLETNYLVRIGEANTRSHLEFTANPSIEWRRELEASVRYHGNVVAQSGKSIVEQPFDITLTLLAVPRSTLATVGFKVIGIEDN